MEVIQGWYAKVLTDVSMTQALIHQSIQSGMVPALSEWPVMSLVLSALVVNVGLLLLSAKGRRFLWDCFETVVASAIVVVLLITLISIPTGLVYFSYRLLSTVWWSITSLTSR
mmetsp:Transcript_33006/g.93464  ORF Transcript_33006/g.93464 Transcript_33006/m.93464 type:complete len:113 (-) Transcript_33006:365-703(-)